VPFKGISLTKEVFQRFLGIGNYFCQKNLTDGSSQSTTTVVILMGMSKLEEIVSIFQSSQGGLQVAIIKMGTTLKEKLKIGTTINTIREVAENK
jgi:uroporphyrin-III C-methyltransferase